MRRSARGTPAPLATQLAAGFALGAALLASPAAAQSDDAPAPAPAEAAIPEEAALPEPAASAEPQAAPASAPAGEAPRRGPPPYSVEIEAPAALRPLLEEFLDLTRYRDDPGLADITEGEIRRLMAATPQQVRSLLETEGYFSPEVEVTRQPGSPPRLRVAVQPGPRTTVQRLTIEVQGAAQEAAEAGDADALALLKSLHDDWRLPLGRPFRQSDWNSAKGGLLARLGAEGYPRASWSGTAAEIDAPRQSARLFVVADSGPLHRFGPIQVRGLELYREEAVTNLRTFNPGDPYREKLLLDYQERLQRSGLFSSAAVTLNTRADTPEATPVRVRVRERPLRELTLALGVADTTGPRVSAEHTHRRVFGLNWVARSKIELGRTRNALEAELLSHPKPRQYRNLFAVGFADFKDPNSADTTEWRVRLGRQQEGEHLKRLYYAEYTGSTLETPLGKSTAQAVLGNYQWSWHQLDSVILPTRGVSVATQAGAGLTRSNTKGSGPFGRLHGRLNWYRPLGGWYASARAEAGQVITQPGVGVPESLLFRAGGDDSVRGYAYRSIGPTVAGTVVGGKMVTTASAEIARPLSARLPALWGAAFVDAGDAMDQWSEIDLKIGYGLGLRYRSPVGPLKLDVAYGQQEKRLRLHLSIGIAF